MNQLLRIAAVAAFAFASLQTSHAAPATEQQLPTQKRPVQAETVKPKAQTKVKTPAKPTVCKKGQKENKKNCVVERAKSR
ncbi:hypothetical protein ACO34A_19100 [Rhizobium sp. ACO-34A]|nr:hypothetical protein [Rhizobium sp. ACO-34A]ATN35915.1 hypothetical protein ACO34A_19100 [Rhizobium sp. ACO-34A]